MIYTSPVPVLDVHHHLADLTALVSQPTSGAPTTDPRFSFMDDHGIAQIVISPQSSEVTAANAARINDAVAAYRDASPIRVAAALATCDPTKPDHAVAEIARAASELDSRGVIFHHHFQGTVVDDARMTPVLEAAKELGLPVFIHILAGSVLESPYRLERLAQNHPQVTIVALDGFSSPAQAPEMLPMAVRCPNVYFDTGVMTAVNHGLGSFLDTVGAERLLYGSDFYSKPRLFHVPFPLYELLNMGRSEEELQLILAGNARRLLGIT